MTFDKVTLTEMYVERDMTIHEVASELESNPSAVYKALLLFDIPRRRQGPLDGRTYARPTVSRLVDRSPKQEIADLLRSPAADKFIQRYWKHVGDPTARGCREWTGAHHHRGYGVVTIEKRTYYAHRVGFVIATGESLGRDFVCHHCDNPPCQEPSHLFRGNAKINNDDARRKGRLRSLRGEENPFAKLTDAQAIEIREQLALGTSQRTLARMFGVSRSVIQHIAGGRTWKHLL